MIDFRGPSEAEAFADFIEHDTFARRRSSRTSTP
jgi:hypothetical protein